MAACHQDRSRERSAAATYIAHLGALVGPMWGTCLAVWDKRRDGAAAMRPFRRVWLALAVPLLLLGAAGWTAYRHMRQEGLDAALVGAANEGNARRVRHLLSLGADPNARPGPRVPSSLLARLRDVLPGLRGRADPRYDRRNPTALLAPLQTRAVPGSVHLATIPPENVEVTRALLEAGADTEARDVNGATPLILAAEWRFRDTVRLLLDHGAAVDAVSGGSPGTALALAVTDDERDREDPYGAAISGMLLAAGADPNLLDESGNGPLLIAAQYGCVKAMRVLLAHGALPDRCAPNDPAPLFEAAYGGHMTCARILLQAGADPTLACRHGTPQAAARSEGYAALARLLRRAEADWRRKHRTEGRTRRTANPRRMSKPLNACAAGV